jgi:Concanavalin A-like lectin/glucanases superfamily
VRAGRPGHWQGEPGGRGGRRRGTVRGLAAAAAALAVTLAVGAAPASADAVFSDGFESGDFSAWSQLQTAGDGIAAVQSAVVRTGALAAQLSESANSGSKAYARKTFPAVQQDLTVSGDFMVTKAGASGGNVPFFRLLDPTSARVVSLYRQNNTSGSIGLNYGGAYFSSMGALALNTWATIALHVIPNGASSTIEVFLNGTAVYRTTTASLSATGISTIQIGNDTAAQAFALYADTISAQSAAAPTPSPPVNTAPPSISGTPQQGQTLTASPGTWTGDQPITYAYQWQGCDSAGTNCAAITGATNPTYAVGSADIGSTLRVTVTATNPAGSATANSNATTVVQAAATAPSNTSPPAISGTPQDGQTLSASTGSWTGSQPISYGYQWQRCSSDGTSCAAIAGATNATYVVASADVGSTLRVAVTATNSVGTATATSAATAGVQGTVASGGLVAFWHMDETSGSVMYDSVAAHNGTIRSVVLGLPGFAGTAYSFNGSSSYVSVPTANDLNPGSATVTMIVHVNTTSTAPAPPADWDVIRKGLYTTAGGEYKMEWQQSGQASCGFNGSAGYAELIAGPKINDGQWHTVQCVKSATAIKIVVDGQTFSKAANIGTISNSDPVVLGARPGSDWYKGLIDEAGIQIA